MLAHLRSPNFRTDFLRYLDQDPVHNLTEARNLERRCLSDRNIFFWVEDNQPAAVLCVAYTQGLTDDVETILNKDSALHLFPDHAVFYSVFKTDAPSTTPNVGATLIREAAAWIARNHPEIKNYVTMSPIPSLSAHFSAVPAVEDIAALLAAQRDPVSRFHLRNGARVLRVIPAADHSERRLQQSWGAMVNYDYTQTVLGS